MIRFQQLIGSIVAWIFCLALLLVGCNGKPTTKQATTRPLPQQQAAVPESKRVAEETPMAIAPTVEQVLEYNYNAQDRRDPFRSILITTETTKKIDVLPPLQRTEIAEMRLIGIVWGSLGYSAMIQTPDGKGYTIRVGIPIGPNNGVVKRITERNLIVEEKFTDIFGEKKTREIVMDLHPQKEGSE